jgi:hypothetical protein
LIFWYSDILIFWYSDILIFWYSDILIFWVFVWLLISVIFTLRSIGTWRLSFSQGHGMNSSFSSSHSSNYSDYFSSSQFCQLINDCNCLLYLVSVSGLLDGSRSHSTDRIRKVFTYNFIQVLSSSLWNFLRVCWRIQFYENELSYIRILRYFCSPFLVQASGYLVSRVHCCWNGDWKATVVRPIPRSSSLFFSYLCCEEINSQLEPHYYCYCDFDSDHVFIWCVSDCVCCMTLLKNQLWLQFHSLFRLQHYLILQQMIYPLPFLTFFQVKPKTF